MDDLRVLEQQQRESQRLLTSIKLTKKHKFEQLSKSEQQLATAKFANGENRAMLTKHRQMLSQKMRELGTLKIRRANGSQSLKSLDFKIRKALSTSDRLRVYRRKLHVAIVTLESMVSMQSRQKQKYALMFKNVEMKRDDARHREELFKKSITDFRLKSNTLSNDILRTRQSTSEYDMDLVNAKQMEASTKYRVESIMNDIKLEEKGHHRTKIENQEKLAVQKSYENEVNAKLSDIKPKIQSYQKLVLVEVERCKSYQMDEGLEPNGPPFNIKRIQERSEAEERQLEKESNAYNEKIARLEQTRIEINLKKEEISKVKLKVAENIEQVERDQSIEDNRREDHASLLAKLGQERKEVDEVSYFACIYVFIKL